MQQGPASCRIALPPELLLPPATFFFFGLGMPTPRALPIETCGAHLNIMVSVRSLRTPSVHWSKPCSSAWHAWLGRAHDLRSEFGTAKRCQHDQHAPFSCEASAGVILAYFGPTIGSS